MEYNKSESANRYDSIPEHLITNNKSILDIGCSDGLGLTLSKYKNIFLSNKYFGVEIDQERSNEALDRGFLVVNYDFLDPKFNTSSTKTFDLIIVNEIIAHININQWKAFFDKMKLFLNDNGSIVLSTIYNEKEHDNTGWDRPHQHVVLNIDDELMERFLPGSKKKMLFPWHFIRDCNERWSWALLRWIKRILTRHEYVGIILPKKKEKQYIWRKE